MHPWHGSRSRWIAEFPHWSLEVGKLIAQYEVPTDKEMLTIKLDARQRKRIQFWIPTEPPVFFRLQRHCMTWRNEWIIRCSIFKLYFLFSIEPFLPETPFENSWLNKMSDMEFLKTDLKVWWNAYCQSMNTFLTNARKWWDTEPFVSKKFISQHESLPNAH